MTPTSPSPGARSVFAEISMYCSRGSGSWGVSSDSSLKTYPSRDLLVLQISFLGILLVNIPDNGISIPASGHSAAEIPCTRYAVQRRANASTAGSTFPFTTDLRDNPTIAWDSFSLARLQRPANRFIGWTRGYSRGIRSFPDTDPTGTLKHSRWWTQWQYCTLTCCSRSISSRFNRSSAPRCEKPPYRNQLCQDSNPEGSYSGRRATRCASVC